LCSTQVQFGKVQFGQVQFGQVHFLPSLLFAKFTFCLVHFLPCLLFAKFTFGQVHLWPSSPLAKFTFGQVQFWPGSVLAKFSFGQVYFTGIRVPGVDISQPEPQKHAFLSDFGSDLRQKGGFRGLKYFLKVVMKLKVLQFTLLVSPVGPL
jgi:hypothetical protein